MRFLALAREGFSLISRSCAIGNPLKLALGVLSIGEARALGAELRPWVASRLLLYPLLGLGIEPYGKRFVERASS